MTRAQINRATEAADLNWNEPKRATARRCIYTSVEGARVSVYQYEGDPQETFDDRSVCKTKPVDLSPTAYVCNVGDERPYFATAFILRGGRSWGMLTEISKNRGLESKSELIVLARLLAEIEGFDKKQVLKVTE